MIRLAVRLATAGGRQGLVRLAVTVVGAAVGVAILLLAAGLEPAMVARGERLAQRASEGQVTTAATLPANEPAPGESLLMASTHHHIAGQRVTVVDIAATDVGAPVPPGLATVPGPGQVYVSPALQRTDPSAFGLVDQADVVGTVSAPGLADPNELVLWRGWTVDTLRSAIREPVLVSGFPLDTPEQAWWTSDLARRVGVAGAAMVIIVPVVVFIGIMLRLGAMQRQRRLAALSLVGATPRQLNAFAVAEGLVVGLAATAIAWPIYLLGRQAAARVALGGHAWFPTDLQPRPEVLLAIGVLVPAVAAVAGRLSLRRVTASPLGVSARSRPASTSRWRIAVAIVGMLLVIAAAGFANYVSATVVTIALVGGAALVLLGLPAAAPWWIRQVARRATSGSSAPLLIAARRVDDDPADAFRAASGIVLAVLGVTLVVSYVTGNLGQEHDLTASARVDGVIDMHGVDPVLASQLADRVKKTAGSASVAVVRRRVTTDGDPVLFIDCHQINASGIAQMEPCPAHRWHSSASEASTQTSWRFQDGTTMDVPTDRPGTIVHEGSSFATLGTDDAFPAASLPRQILDRSPVWSIVLGGDPSNLDRVAAVAASVPGATLDTPASRRHSVNMAFLEAQRAVFLLCAIIVAVGAASLVATLLGSMLASRSTIVHLRRLGLMRRDLRRTLLWQSLIPLAATVPFALGAGLATAAAFTHAVSGRFAPPLLPLAAMTVGAILVAQILTLMSYPTVERSTRPGVANDE